MANYFRITAYHPEQDVSIIVDSFGKFEKLWQFSAFLVSRGFKVIEVGNEGSYTDANIPRADINTEKLILRACDKGEPICREGCIEVKGRAYLPVKE